MNRTQKNTENEDTLPDALRYDDTVIEYIEAEKQSEEDEDLPEPPEDHVEVLEDGEEYRVHDPARDTFELDHNAPLETPMDRQLRESMDDDIRNQEALVSDRQAPVNEAMRPEEEDQTASEMVQDDWLDEQAMMDMAQLDDVLDPVESE